MKWNGHLLRNGLSFAKYYGRETAVVRHLRMALLSHIPSCVYRKTQTRT